MYLQRSSLNVLLSSNLENDWTDFVNSFFVGFVIFRGRFLRKKSEDAKKVSEVKQHSQGPLVTDRLKYNKYYHEYKLVEFLVKQLRK